MNLAGRLRAKALRIASSSLVYVDRHGGEQLRHLRRQRELKILREYRPYSRILFVCFGNIYRSAFAAEVVRSSEGRWRDRVDSVGLYPVANRVSPHEAIQAAERLGYSLSQHRSARADQATYHPDVLLVGFDPLHQFGMKRLAPLHHVFMLGAMSAMSSPVYIRDPYGRTDSEINRTFERIVLDVRELLAELDGDRES